MADSPRDQESLNDRLDFIGLDQKARAALSKLRPLLRESIGPGLDIFYQKVKSRPETRKLFTDERHMANAKSAQERHWDDIAAANFNSDYASAVTKVGLTHARIGLEPRWYIGGYALIMEQLIRAIVKDHWPSLMRMAKGRSDAMAEALASLVKAAMLDMDLAISVYLETLEGLRQKAELGHEAIKRENELAVNTVGVGLSKLAAKDLTYRMSSDIPETYRKLQVDFNAAIEQLEAAIRGVTDSVSAIHAGTQEILKASDDLSQRTEHQASSLEETAAALDEITATVKKSAEGASHARQIVAAADDDAKKSAVVVRQAVSAMDAISKSSQQISQIIGVIDEIAFQTNLLALNAGVEAARAGEAGRGFAVVASEVRALAQRSAEAAKEIKGLISASTTQVDHGVKLVAETGESLDRIMAQVAEINIVVSEIASGAKEQAAGLDQVNTAINQMDQVTQQNATMVEQSTAASHSLSQETDQLSELVGQFRIGRTNDSDSMRRELKKAAPHAFRSPQKAPAAHGARADANKTAPRPVQAAPKAVAGGGGDKWDEF